MIGAEALTRRFGPVTVLAALDLVLSVASRATFRREEILTRWR